MRAVLVLRSAPTVGTDYEQLLLYFSIHVQPKLRPTPCVAIYFRYYVSFTGLCSERRHLHRFGLH